MAEEPSEKEERLSKQEERLTHAHERRKKAANMPTKRTTGGGNFGKAIGGIGEFFGEHKMIVLAVVGFGIVFYVIMKGRQTSSTTTANQQGSLAGNQTTGTATALDALQTQLNNLAATVSAIPNGPAGATGPAGPAGPSGTSGTGGIIPTLNWKAPLIPSGTYSGPNFSNLKSGTKYTYQGVQYTLGAGAGGRLWGTTSQGNQVLLYGPSSAYNPPAQQPLNSQANHSP